MIVRGGTTFLRALRSDWLTLAYFSSLSLLSELLHHFAPLEQASIPQAPLTVLITAMSIFLGFQINQCYERWWEARRLWGQLVNLSRGFGRQVTTLLTGKRLASLADAGQASNVQRALVYRQIAYANALRMNLRAKGAWSAEEWAQLTPWLEEQDLRELQKAKNVPTRMIQLQAQQLAALVGKDWAEQQILMQLDETLNQFYEVQGGCERIKRTAFPDRFRFHTRSFVWLVATLIPFSLIQTEQLFDVIAIFTETLLAFVFVTIERIGSELRDPFEGHSNDTPMSTLCRLIEIDLRQQLGESELPAMLEPVNGVLL